MFYSQIILAKKGPLGKVWQAAHWGDRKLGRPAIFATDISATVDTITNPAAPMALRVSGHLLLGVVRIYSRQVKYLIDDCQQAMVKVKMAYRPAPGGGGANKGGAGEAAIIDIQVNPAGARALNISNFGEYSELDFSRANFEIPFDITNETAEEDWVPAELEEQALDIAPEQPQPEDSPAGGTNNNNNNSIFGAGDEEEWGAFEPEDDDEEEDDENKSKDDSTVSEIEKTRAANNESMVSDPNTSRRASVLNQTGESGDGAAAVPNVGDNSSLSDQEFPAADDDFMMGGGGGGDDVMGMDDDQQPPPNDSLRLELSNDDSKDNISNGAAGAGISFGDEEDEEENKEATAASSSNKKKRKSADDNQKSKKKKKKRKVVTDFEATELTSDHIRNMLADTSKIVKPVIHPATWVPGQKKNSSFGLTDRQLLRRYATVEQLLQRPALADDGHLAPELLDLWARNTAPIRGEPFAYNLRQEEAADDKDEDSVEKARGTDENSVRDDFPPADDDNEFPEADGGDNPFPEDDQDNGIPFDDSMEDQIEMQDGGEDVMGVESPEAGSKGSMEGVFSLGATNELDENFGDDDEERQTIEDTTATWHKNTIRVFQVLKNKMAPKEDDSNSSIVEHVSYNELSQGVTRRTAAGVFFELLALKTLNFVELNQDEAFGDINITPGVKFMEDPPTAK